MANEYSQTLMSWYRAEDHRGELSDALITETGYNPKCGDKVTFYLSRDDATNALIIRFVPEACMLCTASAEAAIRLVYSYTNSTDSLTNLLSLVVHKQFNSGCKDDIELPLLNTLKEYPARETCLTLPWDTLANALHRLTTK